VEKDCVGDGDGSAAGDGATVTGSSVMDGVPWLDDSFMQAQTSRNCCEAPVAEVLRGSTHISTHTIVPLACLNVNAAAEYLIPV
jgi:hypothetical protein